MGAPARTGIRGRPGGVSLTRRAIAVSVLVSASIGIAFLLLDLAIEALRSSESRANHALEVVVAANRVERLIIDVEATQGGFIITGQRRFLRPWDHARSEFKRQAARMESLASAGDAGQGLQAHQIAAAGQSYISNYSVPLVAMAQRDLRSVRTLAVTEEGQRQVDALRTSFRRFIAREQRAYEARQNRADMMANWVIAAASAGVAGSIIVILFSGGYLTRSVVRPVRRASAMAGRVASGDLTARMPETGPGEVGSLEQSFNIMADSLTTSRDQVRRGAEEQSALRRVATLVARGDPPAEVFSVVAGETGRLLAAEATAIARFEPDGNTTVAGSWDKPGDGRLALRLGSRWPAADDGVASRVRRTGEPARLSSYDSVGGPASAWARQHGIRSAVGSPIVVNGRLWGTIIAFSGAATQYPDDTDVRLRAFTELVAMAVANTESRAELAASRARVVSAADETRRRIERDLHDGTQQRLISLALELRAAEAQVRPEQGSLHDQSLPYRAGTD